MGQSSEEDDPAVVPLLSRPAIGDAKTHNSMGRRRARRARHCCSSKLRFARVCSPAWWWSLFTHYFLYKWLEPFMTKRSNGIKLDETLPLGADLESAAACDRVEAEVQAAMAPGGSGSLFRALWNSFRSRLVGQAPLHAVVVVAELADPMILAQLLMIVGGDDNGHIDLRRGAMYVTAMCVIKLVYRCVREVVVTRDDLTNDLVANALKTLVYRKALRLRALAPYSTGEVLNRINDDPWTISSLTYRVNQSWTTVLHLGGLIAFEYYLIGPSALLTLVCIAVVIAINYKLSARTEALWESNGEISDARVKLINEAITGVKVLKTFVLERVFAQRVERVRERQLRVRTKIAILNVIEEIEWNTLPTVLAALTLFTASRTGVVLSMPVIFAVVSTVWGMNHPMMRIPWMIKSVIESRVASDRLKKFLRAAEMDPSAVVRAGTGLVPGSVVLNHATFRWDASPAAKTDDDAGDDKSNGTKEAKADVDPTDLNLTPEEPVLRDVSVQIAPGELVAIIGSVGASKSSLLEALCGSLDLVSGSAAVAGTMAYASQTAWIQNGTLRSNVCFGAPFDEGRYRATLKAAALEPDIALMAKGDLTHIGEHGINLSGGQKARVALARAVYADADVVLMDDPLAAVDSYCSKYLFEECISGVLAGKTRLLVTHHLHCLPHCDRVLVFEAGRLVEAGTYDELIANGAATARLLASFNLGDVGGSDKAGNHPTLAAERNAVEGDALAAGKAAAENDEARLELGNGDDSDGNDDGDANGTEIISRQTYLSYLRMAGWTLTVASVAILVLVEATAQTSGFLIGSMTVGTTDPGAISWAVTVNMMLGLVEVVLTGTQQFMFALHGLRASRAYHVRLLATILAAPVKFFENTSSGKILSRFARDMGNIDSGVNWRVREVMVCGIGAVSLVVITLAASPVTLLLMVPIYFVLRATVRRYRSHCKQVESLRKTLTEPAYRHFNETLAGLSTIRAFGKEDQFRATAHERVDACTRARQTYILGNCWLNARLELSTVGLFAFSATYILLTVGRATSPVTAAIGIKSIMQLSGTLSWSIYCLAQLETAFVSVERIRKYLAIEPERYVPGDSSNRRVAETAAVRRPLDDIEAGVVAGAGAASSKWDSWDASVSSNSDDVAATQQLLLPPPSRNPSVYGGDDHHEEIPPLPGIDIEFDDVVMKYSEELEPALRGVTFSIKGGESVGVVGRTGAGKSTLTMVLFRLRELCAGRILVGGVDISTMPLAHLRSNLAFIPQESILFSGTVRDNLDPSRLHTDAELWAVLAKVSLREFFETAADDAGLSFNLTEKGGNLSAGQAQLLCLARALVKQASIIVMDEATSACDAVSDAVVQEVVRTEFAACTVIVIAHRLHSVVEFDRVLVMGAGRVLECDSPRALLSRPGSEFGHMVDETGRETAAHLRSMAGCSVLPSTLHTSPVA